MTLNTAPRTLSIGRQHFLLIAALFAMMTSPAYAWDYDFRGYLGYVAVDSDDGFSCNNKACKGVFDESLFYGLSASIHGEHLGAQVIVSQDLEEDPDISLAQATWRQQLFSMDLGLRAGKIIVPLGLYGSQRITPTTQPGLVFPQSFLLNAYYDILTLSEEGLGIDLRGDILGFKAAYYEPEDVLSQRTVTTPGSPGPLDFLLGGLLGLDAPTGLGGTPPQQATVVDEYTNKAAYIGVDYRSDNYLADAGWIRQEVNNIELDAYNAGIQTSIGNLQPSIEVFELKFRDSNSKIEGISLNFLYSGDKWQTFLSGVTLDLETNDTQELVLGGVYFWGETGQLSTRVTWHRLDGDYPGVTTGIDKADALGVAVGYSWD